MLIPTKTMERQIVHEVTRSPKSTEPKRKTKEKVTATATERQTMRDGRKDFRKVWSIESSVITAYREARNVFRSRFSLLFV